MPFAHRLKQARLDCDCTQDQVAARLGITRSTYAGWEAPSKERQPDFDMVKRLAEVLGVTTDYLLGLTPDPRRQVTIPIPEGAIRLVPVLGTIRAGQPILAEEHIDGYEEVSEDDLKGGEHFFLRVRGDSMSPQINDGYLVLIRLQPQVEDGDITVVNIDDEDASLKRFYKAGNHAILRTDSPADPPLVLPPSRFRIVGKVVQVRFEPR